MATLTMWLPLPPKSHLPNRRPHSALARMLRSRETAKYREDCAWIAMVEARRSRLAFDAEQPIEVAIELRRPRANMDADGALRYVKHALDGVADGIRVNDRIFRPEIPKQVGSRPHGVKVTLTQEATDP